MARARNGEEGDQTTFNKNTHTISKHEETITTSAEVTGLPLIPPPAGHAVHHRRISSCSINQPRLELVESSAWPGPSKDSTARHRHWEISNTPPLPGVPMPDAQQAFSRTRDVTLILFFSALVLRAQPQYLHKKSNKIKLSTCFCLPLCLGGYARA